MGDGYTQAIENQLAEAKASRAKLQAERYRLAAIVDRVQALLDDPVHTAFVSVDQLQAALGDKPSTRHTDQQEILDQLATATTSPAEYLARLRQAVTIAQAGGIDDRTLEVMLHLNAARRFTPTVVRRLREVGIEADRVVLSLGQAEDVRPPSVLVGVAARLIAAAQAGGVYVEDLTAERPPTWEQPPTICEHPGVVEDIRLGGYRQVTCTTCGTDVTNPEPEQR